MYTFEFWAALDKLVETSEIVIDRAKGTPHPRYTEYIYPLDYGYLDGTSSMDGEGIDLWLGSKEDRSLTALLCTVDLVKRDSEIKLLLGCTEEEIQIILDFHNQHELMRGMLVRRT
jgi:inorganic pyrophosphatase